MISILVSANRFYLLRDEGLVRELQGYYFLPCLGLNANMKKANHYIEIIPDRKGKKLLATMRVPDIRQCWKKSGQTNNVKFKMRKKKNIQALSTFLIEKGIEIQDPPENPYLALNNPDDRSW